MPKSDDSRLDPDSLRAVEERASKLLDRSCAWDRFPTPIEDILQAAQLHVAPSSAFDPARILTYIRKKTADAAKYLKSALSKVFGIYDADEYIIHIDDTVVETKQNFLDLKDAIHVGHSTGGGEVVHYLARHGESRVAKAAIISAVPPLMLKTAANPTGQPKEVFDGLQAQLAANRAQFYYDVPAGPFYGYNRPGAKPSQGVIWNWWRQGMMGGTKAHYDGIVAFSQRTSPKT